MAGTGPHHSSEPPSAQERWLEQVVLHLANREDWRGVVRLVERWSGAGEPSSAALLAQARAFLALSLMDRAWVRLRELNELQPRNQEAQLLTARMFIERGWPVRARKILAQLPESSLVAELSAQAAQPPRQPPPEARQIESSGSAPEQLALAETYLAAGSFLRAKTILERLARQRGPWTSRVEDLLWATAGDFAREDGDPLELARSLAPDVIGLEDDSGSGDLFSSSEVTATGVGEAASKDKKQAFPALFRRVDPLEDGNTTEEVTLISRLATTAELQEHREPTDTDEFRPGAGDTQIRMVIQTGSDQAHVTRDDEDYRLRETLNLKDYLASVGMQAPDVHSDLDEVDLEEEDDDLVVVTRREDSPRDLPPAEPDTAELQKPIEVVEQPIARMAPPIQKQKREAIEAFDPPTVGESPPPTRPRELPEHPIESEELVPVGGFNAGPRLVALGVAIVVVLGLLLWVGMKVGDRVSGDSLVDDTVSVIGAGSFAELRQAEDQLAAAVASGVQPVGAHQAAYALVELVLWAEYTGDGARLDAARQAIQDAAEAGGAGSTVALAVGYQRYHQGDLEQATASLAPLDERDPEVAHLAALVALDHGDWERARALADRTVADHGGPRYQLLLSEVCQASGDLDCARAAAETALRDAPKHPQAQLQALELQSADKSARVRLAGLDNFLDGSGDLPPRVAGNARARQAEMLQRLGDDAGARKALDAALALDPDNPELLLALGARHWRRGQLRDSLVALDKALSYRPSDYESQSARMQVLAELDQVEEMRQALEGLPPAIAAHPRRPVLEARVLAAEDDPAAVVKLLEPYLSKDGSDPVAAWLLGQAYALLDRSVDGQSLLLSAADKLLASDDPFLRQLGPRALAAAAPLSDQGDALAARALLEGGSDPLVHTALGAWYDTDPDRRALAAEHYDRAVDLAPDHALALYQHGQFYLDARDNLAHTRPSWSRYLDQEPSGSRARRARDRLGR